VTSVLVLARFSTETPRRDEGRGAWPALRSVAVPARGPGPGRLGAGDLFSFLLKYTISIMISISVSVALPCPRRAYFGDIPPAVTTWICVYVSIL